MLRKQPDDRMVAEDGPRLSIQALGVSIYYGTTDVPYSQDYPKRTYIRSKPARIPKYRGYAIAVGCALLMVGGVAVAVTVPGSIVAGEAEIRSDTVASTAFQAPGEEAATTEHSLPLVQSQAMQEKETGPKELTEHTTFSGYEESVPSLPVEMPAVQEQAEDGAQPALTAARQAQLTKLASALTAIPESELQGVCPSVVLGQAIVLSDWGRSSAAMQHNNFFGLTDDEGKLRRYGSAEESIHDFVRHITRSPYYKDARFFPGQAVDSCDSNSRTFLLSGQDAMSVRRILVFDYLLDKGLTEDQAAGVIGNFVRESGINPAAVQKHGGSARGLAQWEGGRYKALAAFAKRHKQPWSDLYVQLDFLWRELNGSERKAYTALKKTHNPREAARIFSNLFERPNPKPSSLRMDIRVKGAMDTGTAWALHERRVAQVLELVKAQGLAAMVGGQEAQTATKVSTNSRDNPRPQEPFKLVAGAYRDKQNDILPNTGKQAHKMLVDVDNDGVSETPSKNISAQQHLNIVERELNEAARRLSRSGYERAIEGIKDVSKRVERDFRNFNGHRQGTPLGYPKKPGDIEVHPNHFTATQSAANDMDGYEAARSTQNAGRGVGFNYFINNKGDIYLVSNAYCHNMLPYNGLNYKDKSVSTEVAAAVQGEISGIQYEALAYLNAHNLIRTGKVKKGVPVSPAVKTRIVGHSAGNDAKGMHSDMPEIVMTAMHELTIQVLEEQGYLR